MKKKFILLEWLAAMTGLLGIYLDVNYNIIGSKILIFGGLLAACIFHFLKRKE